MRRSMEIADLLHLARDLRQRQTPTEEVLWELVRDRRFLGLKFRRQQQLGTFIADFYCHEARLMIELDGPVHEGRQQADRDENREGWLRESRYIVLRFPNERVLNDPQAVLADIAKATGRHFTEPKSSEDQASAGRVGAPLSRVGVRGGRERGRG